MATSVSLGYCLWLAGQTWNDSIGRNQMVAAATWGSAGGVLMSVSNPLAVAWTSGLNFTIQAGAGVIPSSAGDGEYQFFSPSVQTLGCAAASTSPRIDVLCATVIDNGNNTSYAELQIVQGTPAASPTVPATPSNSIALYQIAVAANVVNLAQANFTDVRTYTAYAGGVVVCPNMAALPVGGPGVIGYDVVNGRLFALTATGAGPLAIKAYSPIMGIRTTNLSYPGSNTLTSVASVNFNADGSDYMIIGRWSDSYTTTATSLVQYRLYIDSTLVQLFNHYTHGDAYSDGFYHAQGGIITHQTNALKGTTPTVGAHTASLYVQGPNSGVIQATTSMPIELTVDVVIGH